MKPSSYRVRPVVLGVVLFANLALAEALFHDQTLGRLTAVKRSFKIDIDACQEKWDIDTESEKSSCSLTTPELVHGSGEKGDAKNPNPALMPILDNDDLDFDCEELAPSSKDKKNYQGNLRILTHGTFGYIVTVNSMVKFKAIKACLEAAIQKTPDQSVTATFVQIKPEDEKLK